MKLSIRQNVLQKALEQGALAALSDTAQTDTGNLSLFSRSIRLVVDDKLTIESITNLMATQYTVEGSKENGIAITTPGTVVVPAKELMSWVKVQNKEAIITMKFDKLDVPEIVNSIDGDDSSAFVIKKIGALKFISKNERKSGVKWELDCYDAEDITYESFNSKGETCFEVKSESFKKALKGTSFAALAKYHDHILGSVSLQTHDDKVYVVATDTNRCAVYKLKDAKEVNSKEPILVLFSLVGEVMNVFADESMLTFSYDQEKERLYFGDAHFKIRLSTVEKNKEKFPSIGGLLTLPYEPLAEIPIALLKTTLKSASLVNKTCASFEFKIGDEAHNFIVTSLSESRKYKPVLSKANIETPSKALKAVWGVRHLLEALNAIKGDTVQLSIPENRRNVKVVPKDDDSFLYFSQVIDNPIYH